MSVYESADYVVDGFVIKVGHAVPMTLPWAYLTAWNPHGERASEADNAAAQASLVAALSGRTFFRGRGQAPDGSWSEDSLLVLDISRADAEALGRRFRQKAIVVGGPIATLVYLE